MIDLRYRVDVAIPYGEASASLQRLRSAIHTEAAGHDPKGQAGPEDVMLQTADDEVRSWEQDLHNEKIRPDDLPRMYGAYANTQSSYPRLARIFTGERTVLEAMRSSRYGSGRWYGD